MAFVRDPRNIRWRRFISIDRLKMGSSALLLMNTFNRPGQRLADFKGPRNKAAFEADPIYPAQTFHA